MNDDNVTDHKFRNTSSQVKSSQCIGATTVGTRETGPPTFRLGDKQCIGSPNYLGIVFKNQEISRHREPTNKHSSHQNAGFSI